MDDRELLELAAKAAGFGIENFLGGREIVRRDPDGQPVYWNPLKDDGDALRLAVKLRLNLNFEEWDGAEYVCVTPHRSHQGQDEVIDDDESAATRRAIVRAAAEIGRAITPANPNQVKE